MRTSLVLGFFDGVHKAHREVINSAFKYSDNVVVITFKDSPALYFNSNAKYILSRENSLNKLKKLGVKKVVELDFPKIANINAKDYLEFLINTYNPISISTGFNHTFGNNKTGNPEFLKENQIKYNYKYICVPAVVEDNEIISSSLIKKYLLEGNLPKANQLLESNFIIEGKVIHGAKIGRTIGFPTANINYPEDLVKIPYGVYGVLVYIEDYNQNKQLYGLMNWGIKPTVNSTEEPVAEVHIIDFDEDLYGKNIKIEIVKQIRQEKKFKNLEELKNQINEDIRACSEL